MNIRQDIQKQGRQQSYSTKTVRIPVAVENLVMVIADYYRVNPTSETLNKLTQLIKELQDNAS